MKNAIGKLAIVVTMTAIATSQAIAVTVYADSVCTVWRGTPPPAYYIDGSDCDFAYLTTPESTGHGYGVFNLSNVLSALSCTLQFTATWRAGTTPCPVVIYCPGRNLSQQLPARFAALATGVVLANPSFSNSPTDYTCTFNPYDLPLGYNYVFLAWITSSSDKWWRVTNAKLIFH